MRVERLLLASAMVLAGCDPGAVGPFGGTTYTCGDLAFTAEELAAAPPADELGPDGQAALEGHGVEPIDLEDGWRRLNESGSELELIRELDEPESGGPGDVRTHEFLRAETVSGVVGIPDGGWMLDAHGVCTPRMDLGDLASADLALAEEPAVETRQIHLEVYERACASGQAADGRVEVVEQELTDTQLRLVIGVRALDGAQNCPGNPPTALTVDLDEPLGDRDVVDASTLPPQPLQPSPNIGAEERQQAAVEAALAYEPPPSYVMDVDVMCFCPTGRYRVTVVDGEKTDVRLVDPNGDEPADEPLDDAGFAPTIADIQERLRETVASGVVNAIEVEPDGRPVVIDLDPMPNAIDDEISYVITEWHPID